MPDNKDMTSLEAAALILSNGTTTDIEQAAYYDEGTELNLDALQRAHLRRMMGFDFQLKIRDKKLIVYSTEGPFVRTWCGYGVTMGEKTVEKLVDACLRLKLKYEAKLAEEAADGE